MQSNLVSKLCLTADSSSRIGLLVNHVCCKPTTAFFVVSAVGKGPRADMKRLLITAISNEQAYHINHVAFSSANGCIRKRSPRNQRSTRLDGGILWC